MTVAILIFMLIVSVSLFALFLCLWYRERKLKADDILFRKEFLGGFIDVHNERENRLVDNCVLIYQGINRGNINQVEKLITGHLSTMFYLQMINVNTYNVMIQTLNSACAK